MGKKIFFVFYVFELIATGLFFDNPIEFQFPLCHIESCNQMKELFFKFVGCLKLLIMNSTEQETLSSELKEALDEALDASIKGQVYTHEEVLLQTREKYSNLFN